MAAELFRTDRQRVMPELTAISRTFAKAPKNDNFRGAQLFL